MQSDLPHLLKLQQFDVVIDELNEKAQAIVPLIAKKKSGIGDA